MKYSPYKCIFYLHNYSWKLGSYILDGRLFIISMESIYLYIHSMQTIGFSKCAQFLLKELSVISYHIGTLLLVKSLIWLKKFSADFHLIKLMTRRKRKTSSAWQKILTNSLYYTHEILNLSDEKLLIFNNVSVFRVSLRTSKLLFLRRNSS